MPNHRSILILAALSWLSSLALTGASWWGAGLNADSLGVHLTAALAILVGGLLAHSWIVLYALGVRRELARGADSTFEEVSGAEAAASRAQRAGVAALLGLVTLAGLGTAAQVGWLGPRVHGVGSAIVLLLQAPCLVAEANGLEPLRRFLTRLESREIAS